MWFRFVTICLCLARFTTAQDEIKPASSPKAPDWLRGSWTKLEMRICGEVQNADGTPATNFRFTALIDNNPLDVNVENNRFECWVPVGKQQWFTLQLEATATNDKTLIASQWLPMMQLRHYATKGVQLKLQPSDRPTSVTVTYKGKPVEGATVSAVTITGRVTRAISGSDGVATVLLMQDEELSGLTAWTDDFRVGGFHLRSRAKTLDPKANSYSLGLEDGRPLTVRLVDSDTGAPVPDITYELTIGSGKPKYQFIGRTPDWLLTSNAQGEAVCRWFPDWKTHGSYLELKGTKYSLVGKPTMVDGTFLVKLTESTSRRRVTGRVTSDDPGISVAGLCVQIETFQTDVEGRGEGLYAFTDANGRFFADYRRGSTYLLSVGDARLASKTKQMIPFDAETGETKRPTLQIARGVPIKIKVTFDDKPLRNALLWLAVQHESFYIEEGEKHYFTGGRRWSAFTDEDGEATAYVFAGDKLSASTAVVGRRLRAESKDGVIRLEAKSQKK